MGQSAIDEFVGEYSLKQRQAQALDQSEFRAGIVIKITREHPEHFGSSGYLHVEIPARTTVTYAAVLTDPFIDINGEPTVLVRTSTRKGSPRRRSGPESIFW